MDTRQSMIYFVHIHNGVLDPYKILENGNTNQVGYVTFISISILFIIYPENSNVSTKWSSERICCYGKKKPGYVEYQYILRIMGVEENNVYIHLLL